jgi:uncharacterized membrane protein
MCAYGQNCPAKARKAKGRSMGSRLSIAIWLLWLALPFTAADYWRVWDRLPQRVAIHFDINWQANGFTSRQGAFALMVGLITFLLVTFTVTLLLVQRAPKPSFMPWAMLVFFYATTIFVCAINHWMIAYNLRPPG